LVSTLPNGNERNVSEKIRGIFLLPLPTGGQIPAWPKTLEIFFPLLLFGDGRCVLTKEIIFLYKISAALVYIGEMSTPTTHWTWASHFFNETQKFFSFL
jgi:hypothetical protein